MCVCVRPTRTSFSESPLHLLMMLEAEMLKKVVLHWVATALASSVFPVPAGATHHLSNILHSPVKSLNIYNLQQFALKTGQINQIQKKSLNP